MDPMRPKVPVGSCSRAYITRLAAGATPRASASPEPFPNTEMAMCVPCPLLLSAGDGPIRTASWWQPPFPSGRGGFGQVRCLQWRSSLTVKGKRGVVADVLNTSDGPCKSVVDTVFGRGFRPQHDRHGRGAGRSAAEVASAVA